MAERWGKLSQIHISRYTPLTRAREKRAAGGYRPELHREAPRAHQSKFRSGRRIPFWGAKRPFSITLYPAATRRCALTHRSAFVIQLVSLNKPMVRRGSDSLRPGGSEKKSKVI